MTLQAKYLTKIAKVGTTAARDTTLCGCATQLCANLSQNAREGVGSLVYSYKGRPGTRRHCGPGKTCIENRPKMAPRRRYNHTPRGGNSEWAAVSDELRVRTSIVTQQRGIYEPSQCTRTRTGRHSETHATKPTTPTRCTTTAQAIEPRPTAYAKGTVERLSKGKTALRS